MKELDNLMELYLDEIKKITKKGDLTPVDSEAACKALDALMKIDELNNTLRSTEEYSMGRYSSRMPEMSGGYCYDNGYSERRGRNQYNGQYMSRDAYSRHDEAVHRTLDKLEGMRMEATDDRTRRAIDMCIDEINRR